jgi:hypothetical protein
LKSKASESSEPPEGLSGKIKQLRKAVTAVINGMVEQWEYSQRWEKKANGCVFPALS